MLTIYTNVHTFVHLKAWFKIKKTITLNNPCNLLEKLFDSLPWLSPSSCMEVKFGGVGNNFRDSDPFEHLQMYI